VGDALGVQVEQEDAVAAAGLGDRREQPGAGLGGDDLAGVHRALHRRVAVVGHDQGQAPGAVADQRAAEVEDHEGGGVGDRAAEEHDVAAVDVAEAIRM
jgi:hypothetical protein